MTREEALLEMRQIQIELRAVRVLSQKVIEREKNRLRSEMLESLSEWEKESEIQATVDLCKALDIFHSAHKAGMLMRIDRLEAENPQE